MKNVLKRFIKEDIIAGFSVSALGSIDVEKIENQKAYSEVDIGFSGDRIVKELKFKKLINDKTALQFVVECKYFLAALAKKLMHKSPVTFNFVHLLNFLDPRLQVSSPCQCTEKLKKVLAFLVQLQKVNERDCDDIISEFSGYLDTIPVVGSDKFCNFNPVCTRVDIFYSEQLKSFPKLFSLIKMLLVLSHGQASVERGFSVNKEVEVENLMKQSVVAQRVVCEAVKSAGGVSEIKLVNELMTSCSLAASADVFGFLSETWIRTSVGSELRSAL